MIKINTEIYALDMRISDFDTAVEPARGFRLRFPTIFDILLLNVNTFKSSY